MKKLFSVALLGVLSACSTEPAGGPSYFDQNTIPVQTISPITGMPMTLDQQAAFEAAERERLANGGDPLVGTIEDALNRADGTYATDPSTGLPLTNNYGIDPNSDSINLATYSQEQQAIDRAIAARELQNARNQLVIVSPDQIQGASRANALQRFATTTTNNVGEKQYRRSLFSDAETTQSNCAQFRSADDAQKAFLAGGGPGSDPQRLDPDGDGFACGWNPAAYR